MKHQLKTSLKILSLLIAVAATGCAVGPDYKRPAANLPQAFDTASAADAASATIPNNWWTQYGDPALNDLVQTALSNNADVRLAAGRVEEAEAVLSEASAAFFPEIDLGASGTKARSSSLNAQQFPGPLVTKTNRLALSTSFELDFWGKLRRATESARAQALASRYAKDVTTLTLAGTVAQSYFALRSFDAQIAATAATLNASQESLNVARNRAKAGLASDLDLNQAEGARADAANQLRELQRQRTVQEHLLGTLTGNLSLKVAAKSAPDLMTLPIPPLPPAGLPSTLLDRRPDVQQAEQTLVAANAEIGVARAAQLPTFSLTGNFGGQSEALVDVLKEGARVWSVGLGAMMPIFDAGKYSARTRQAEARQKQSAAGYQKAVEAAYKDVADALTNTEQSAASEADVQIKANAARNALRLANLRYKQGYSPYLEVLDAQRSANAAESALVQNRQARLSYSVDLMKALGGGWSAQ